MLVRIVRSIVIFAGVLTLASCSLFGGEAAPEPAYTVILAEEPFEVREYDELVVVKTTMADGSRAAFGRLFGYISGENSGDRSIAMTAPVLNTDSKNGTEISMTAPVLQSGAAEREMIFVLTEEFTLQTAPLPTDPAVSLATIPPRNVAVVRYSGSMQKRASAEEVRLRAWMRVNGLRSTGPAEVAGYNPPWTLPANRRNEVLIPVQKE
jgi:hypothetical protein